MRGGAFIPTDWSPDGKQLTGSTAGYAWVYSLASRTFRRVVAADTTKT